MNRISPTLNNFSGEVKECLLRFHLPHRFNHRNSTTCIQYDIPSAAPVWGKVFWSNIQKRKRPDVEAFTCKDMSNLLQVESFLIEGNRWFLLDCFHILSLKTLARISWTEHLFEASPAVGLPTYLAYSLRNTSSARHLVGQEAVEAKEPRCFFYSENSETNQHDAQMMHIDGSKFKRILFFIRRCWETAFWNTWRLLITKSWRICRPLPPNSPHTPSGKLCCGSWSTWTKLALLLEFAPWKLRPSLPLPLQRNFCEAVRQGLRWLGAALHQAMFAFLSFLEVWRSSPIAIVQSYKALIARTSAMICHGTSMQCILFATLTVMEHRSQNAKREWTNSYYSCQ